MIEIKKDCNHRWELMQLADVATMRLMPAAPAYEIRFSCIKCRVIGTAEILQEDIKPAAFLEAQNE